MGHTPPCGQNSWHTLVKTLPFCNYCLKSYSNPIHFIHLMLESILIDRFKPSSFFFLGFYPEIYDVNLKGTLRTFKQWLALKMRVRCGISIVQSKIDDQSWNQSKILVFRYNHCNEKKKSHCTHLIKQPNHNTEKKRFFKKTSCWNNDLEFCETIS